MAKQKILAAQAAASRPLLKAAFAAVTEYTDAVRDKPAYPSDQALAQLTKLDTLLPGGDTPPLEVFEALVDLGRTTAVPTTGGRYFGYVTGGVLPIGMAARLLADSWDQSSAMHAMSPLAAELERISERWIVELLGLPKETVAGFVTGTSMATFCALAAARHHLLSRAGWDLRAEGTYGAPRIRIVVNEKAHSSIWRCLRLLGVGEAQIERVPTDEQGRILSDKMPDLDALCIVILQAGDVNTGAFDDFDSLCRAANSAGAWTHVDGAFGLWAAASPQYEHLTHGYERADSWACDAHKTLNAPYDCGLVLCRHESSYRAAMDTGAAYAPESPNRDGMFLVPEMSRRARAVETWAILRTLGRRGVAELVEQLCARATQLRDLLHDCPVRIVNEVVFNQVLIRLDTDDATSLLLQRIQDSGEIWCGGSQWNGRAVIRISICSWATTADDIRAASSTIKALI